MDTWFLTVRSLILSLLAISLLKSPSARSLSTSISLLVKSFNLSIAVSRTETVSLSIGCNSGWIYNSPLYTAWIAFLRATESDFFNIYPSHPISTAFINESGLSLAVRKRTFELTFWSLIISRTLRPSRLGILISSKTTFGFILLTALRHSYPSDASAITSMSPVLSRIHFTPSLTIVWSSAIKTLIGIYTLLLQHTGILKYKHTLVHYNA